MFFLLFAYFETPSVTADAYQRALVRVMYIHIYMICLKLETKKASSRAEHPVYLPSVHLSSTEPVEGMALEEVTAASAEAAKVAAAAISFCLHIQKIQCQTTTENFT